MIKKISKLHRVLHVQLPSDDWKFLTQTKSQLDLGTAEVARRALRIGLQALEKAELPGKRTNAN